MEKEQQKETFQSFELREEQAKTVLEKAGCDYSNTTIRKFEKGMINDVFAVGNEYVIKVNTGHPELPKLEREADVMQAAKEDDVPTSRVFAYDESKNTIPYPYLIMERMKGEMLSEQTKDMSEEDKKEMSTKLGNMLGRIHSVDHTQAEALRAPEWINVKSIPEKVFMRLSEVANTGLLTDEELQKVKAFYTENAELFGSDNGLSIQHNNFAADNVLIKDREITGVIDWEWAELGNPEEELAVTLHKGVINKRLDKAFLDGYKQARNVKSDFEVRRVALTLPYYLKVLLEVPKWTHKPEKQEEYITETKKLISQL